MSAAVTLATSVPAPRTNFSCWRSSPVARRRRAMAAAAAPSTIAAVASSQPPSWIAASGPGIPSGFSKRPNGTPSGPACSAGATASSTTASPATAAAGATARGQAAVGKAHQREAQQPGSGLGHRVPQPSRGRRRGRVGTTGLGVGHVAVGEHPEAGAPTDGQADPPERVAGHTRGDHRADRRERQREQHEGGAADAAHEVVVKPRRRAQREQRHGGDRCQDGERPERCRSERRARREHRSHLPRARGTRQRRSYRSGVRGGTDRDRAPVRPPKPRRPR